MSDQPYDLFLSYARLDQDRVRPLAQALKALDLRVFFGDYPVDKPKGMALRMGERRRAHDQDTRRTL